MREKVIVLVVLRLKVDYWRIFSDLFLFFVLLGYFMKVEK